MNTVFHSVGPYEIVGEIGRGGMATVFLATDTRTSRSVALKLVPTGTDREAREILDAERWGAQLQARFCAASRFVPEVYEHGTSGDYFYHRDGVSRRAEPVGRHRSRAADRRARDRRSRFSLCHFLEAAHGFETTIDGQPLRSLRSRRSEAAKHPRPARRYDQGPRLRHRQGAVAQPQGHAQRLRQRSRTCRPNGSTPAATSMRTSTSGPSACCCTRWSPACSPSPRPTRGGWSSGSDRGVPRGRSTAAVRPGFRRSVAKLLAPSLADRYGDATRDSPRSRIAEVRTADDRGGRGLAEDGA